MTKVCTHGRDAALAMRMLEESLRRLQTDHLDLWQIHGVCFDNDPELAYRKGGVLEALDRAKQQGKMRFVGFTGHKHPRIHLDMIDARVTPSTRCRCRSTASTPPSAASSRQVLPEAHRRGIARARDEEPGRHRGHDRARRRDATRRCSATR